MLSQTSLSRFIARKKCTYRAFVRVSRLPPRFVRVGHSSRAQCAKNESSRAQYVRFPVSRMQNPGVLYKAKRKKRERSWYLFNTHRSHDPPLDRTTAVPHENEDYVFWSGTAIQNEPPHFVRFSRIILKKKKIVCGGEF